MRHLIISLAALFCALNVAAQCPQQNTAFESGEKLEYKLFFNWKFVWLNAGSATMQTVSTTHQGKPAYRNSLITRTSKKIDKFFCMRDTITAIVSPDLVPLYYRKGALEGKQYRVNEATYKYRDGHTLVHLLYQDPEGEQSLYDFDKTECAYDMLSMMLRARSFRGSDFRVGQHLDFLLVDHRYVRTQTLVYRGIKNFTTEDDAKITYRCMVFSFVEQKGKKEKEIITFYITDDDNHTPVRLDLFLRFGVAKAYLTTATGLRNPQTSIVKRGK